MRLIWHQMVVCRNMVWQVCTHVEGVSNLFRVLCGSDWVYSPRGSKRLAGFHLPLIVRCDPSQLCVVAALVSL